jgi:protein-tyrosine phosphatase
MNKEKQDIAYETIDQKCIFCEKGSEILIYEETVFCKKCFDQQLKMTEYYRTSRTKFFPEIDKITEKIYLGNEDGQRDLEKLTSLGVTNILNCAAFVENFHPDKFIYENLNMEDSILEDLSKYLPKAYEFIDKSEVVYIHCQAGISRSAAIVIAYLMMKRKINFEDAFELVRNSRKSINPNSGFINQLKSLNLFVFKNKLNVNEK